MKDLTPNIPEVVTEVRELFERYERALVDKNVEGSGVGPRQCVDVEEQGV